MEIIETINKDLENLPNREIWYFGPKSVSCSEKSIVTHRNYKFELCKYDINGNGKKYLKIFDSDEKEIFQNLTIILGYNWNPEYSVEFKNAENPISNLYFHFEAGTNYNLEKILDRIVLIAEKNKRRNKENISFQYTYAYIIFLFFQIRKDESISATGFYRTYINIKKISHYISRQLTDNVNSSDFSKDTLYYKLFDRFITDKLNDLKSKIIFYD
jgi:hypothetical protein